MIVSSAVMTVVTMVTVMALVTVVAVVTVVTVVTLVTVVTVVALVILLVDMRACILFCVFGNCSLVVHDIRDNIVPFSYNLNVPIPGESSSEQGLAASKLGLDPSQTAPLGAKTTPCTQPPVGHSLHGGGAIGIFYASLSLLPFLF